MCWRSWGRAVQLQNMKKKKVWECKLTSTWSVEKTDSWIGPWSSLTPGSPVPYSLPLYTSGYLMRSLVRSFLGSGGAEGFTGSLLPWPEAALML